MENELIQNIDQKKIELEFAKQSCDPRAVEIVVAELFDIWWFRYQNRPQSASNIDPIDLSLSGFLDAVINNGMAGYREESDLAAIVWEHREHLNAQRRFILDQSAADFEPNPF